VPIGTIGFSGNPITEIGHDKFCQNKKKKRYIYIYIFFLYMPFHFKFFNLLKLKIMIQSKVCHLVTRLYYKVSGNDPLPKYENNSRRRKDYSI